MILSTLALLALSAASEPQDPLAALRFLVGACWAAELPNGAGRDTHCFEPMLGGKYIRDRHEVLNAKGGRYAGETVYAWDQAAHRIRYWYWASDGDFGPGTAEPSGDHIDFVLSMSNGEAEPVAIKATWTPLGKDRYRSEQFHQQDGAYQRVWSIEFVRTDAKPDARH